MSLLEEQTNETKTINVGLHGHVLAGFGNYWREKYNCPNIARTLFDKCVENNLKIYVITDDVYGNINGVSRFNQISHESFYDPKLEYERLDDNAFVLSQGKNSVYLLNGQSVRVKDGEKRYDIATFGKEGLSDFPSFEEAKKYFDGEGLLSISILEHPLAEAHRGALTKERLEEILFKKYIDAIEFNSKIAVPNIFKYVPYLKGFTKEKNEDASLIAEKYKIPIVANDDSDTPPQIGLAYNIFPENKINFTNGETITRDINSLILLNKFQIKKGYQDFIPWFTYAVRAKLKG